MDSTVSTLVPHLIQQLCEQALQWQNDAASDHKDAWKLPVYDLYTLFRLPNTTGCSPIDHIDREAKVLPLACEYATRAISSFAESMSAEIRNRCNQLLPIFRLPNEILAIIFQCIVGDEATRAMPLRQRAPFNVSHVSRRWRNVAIETPRLWAAYDIANAHIADIIIDRSKHVPLDIKLVIYPTRYMGPGDGDPWELCFPTRCADVDAAAPITFDLLRPLLPHVHRWGAVVLDGVDDEHHLEMCLPGDPAPNLQKLHIIKNSHFMDSEAILRIPLFNGSTPLLRDLYLSCLSIPLTSSLYTGLTSLKLEYLIYEEGVMPFLLTIGGGCPLLERLILRQVYWDEHPQPTSGGGNQPISLPRLKEPKLSRLQQRSFYPILSSIVSPDAQLYIQVDAREIESELGGVFPLTGFLSNIPPICWMYFTLLQSQPYRGYHLAFDAGDFARGRSVRIVLTLIPLGSAHQLISYFTQRLPLSLRSLALEVMDPALFVVPGFTQ
ncbi:hypothetical protein BOTBODRAFT_545773 [Botryobasidium botryosum FD-172 SS1]|uniref:F-box domain-containing protein n=1 Tax=Botryobasidium botryosum (strain FD-172 SS1) TaxID=930990 RepID=A0A067N2I5_BOTB1|nr:hypothetical protein BOTBODRAFT_545773 [Botryobasidium botryosum FD-172 SS1]